MPVTLHTALNLLWLGISVGVLGWFTRLEWTHGKSGRWRRLLAAFAMCITLFPCISDTDDLFNFSLIQTPVQHRHGGVGNAPPPEESREKSTLHLARLLETLDHYQVAAVFHPAPTVTRSSAPTSIAPSLRTRAVPCNPGRGPPA